jgi:DNA-binding NtrC family response regulator
VNVRIIAATNADLKSKMKDNAFREDLYFRLCVMDVRLPPLRERKEDIPPLTQHFIARFCKEHNLGPKRVSQDLMDLFMAHQWKGNVRELMNLIQRAVIMTPEEVVGPSEAGFKPEFPELADSMARVPDLPYREAKNAVMGTFTRRYLSRALERSGGNVTRAARDSGLERQSFQQIMKKSGLKSEDFRPNATT